MSAAVWLVAAVVVVVVVAVGSCRGSGVNNEWYQNQNA